MKPPEWIAPQLSTLFPKVPVSEEWLHEVKFDGYRLVCRIEDGKVKLFTRHQNDWSKKFAAICKELSKLPLKNAWLDGEVVVLNDDGVSRFQLLQNALSGKSESKIIFYLFDIMFLDSIDLREKQLVDRKEILKNILKNSRHPLVRYSEHIRGNGEKFFSNACSSSLEGVISKQADSLYVSRRTRSWMKIKCIGKEEFVIGGYTDHSKDEKLVGALLLGTVTKNGLVYNGKVGTGFDNDERRDLLKKFVKIERKDSPFIKSEFLPRAHVHWLTPKILAEIQFTERTRDGLLRHPSFQGIRLDKTIEDLKKDTDRSLLLEAM